MPCRLCDVALAWCSFLHNAMLVGKWSALCSLSTGPGSTGPSGASGSAGPVSEVPWDCTAHIMPYLKMLHAWLLRVGATMPSINKPATLAAPMEVRIDHELLKLNKDQHEKRQNRLIPTPAPKTRSKNHGPRSKALYGGRKGVLRSHRWSLGVVSHP